MTFVDEISAYRKQFRVAGLGYEMACYQSLLSVMLVITYRE